MKLLSRLEICIALLIGLIVVVNVVDLFMPEKEGESPLSSRGVYLYKSIFAAEVDAASGFPSPGQFESTEAYFKFLVEQDVMQADSDVFTWKDQPLWYAVEVHSNAPTSTPVLFSRNLDITNVNQQFSIEDVDVDMFGRPVVVFVTKGGAAHLLKKRRLSPKAFNPEGFSAKVLRLSLTRQP